MPFIKSMFSALGVRGVVLIALVGITAYLGSGAYSDYKKMRNDVSEYKSQITQAQTDKDNLNSRIDAEKQRADTAEQSNVLLQTQFNQQKAEAEKYHQLLTALQNKQDKENEQSKNTIKQLKAALARAGIAHTAIPSDVIRMQQESICKVNDNCASSNSH